jgi:hypothetical protein
MNAQHNFSDVVHGHDTLTAPSRQPKELNVRVAEIERILMIVDRGWGLV